MVTEMIIQLVVCLITLISKNTSMIAIDLCKQQELDADPKQYQTLIFLEI